MGQPDYDILLVGGALVGATLALALDQFGYRVALVDANNLNSASVSDNTETDRLDLRTTAVAAATASILDQLNIWSDISTDAGVIAGIQVSQQGHFGTLRLTADEQGVPALGYLISNDASTLRLHRMISERSGITLLAPAEVVHLTSAENTVTLDINHAGSQQSLTGKLLIAVDGARSTLRSMCGIETVDTDYAQQAIVCTVQSELDNHQTAFERFTRSGPLAMLPVQPRINSLVYTVEDTSASMLLALSDQGFPRQGAGCVRIQAGTPRTMWPQACFSAGIAGVKTAIRSPVSVNG